MACIRDEAREEELKEFVREITTQNGMTKEELLERIPHEYKSSLLSSPPSPLHNNNNKNDFNNNKNNKNKEKEEEEEIGKRRIKREEGEEEEEEFYIGGVTSHAKRNYIKNILYIVIIFMGFAIFCTSSVSIYLKFRWNFNEIFYLVIFPFVLLSFEIIFIVIVYLIKPPSTSSSSSSSLFFLSSHNILLFSLSKFISNNNNNNNNNNNDNNINTNDDNGNNNNNKTKGKEEEEWKVDIKRKNIQKFKSNDENENENGKWFIIFRLPLSSSSSSSSSSSAISQSIENQNLKSSLLGNPSKHSFSLSSFSIRKTKYGKYRLIDNYFGSENGNLVFHSDQIIPDLARLIDRSKGEFETSFQSKKLIHLINIAITILGICAIMITIYGIISLAIARSIEISDENDDQTNGKIDFFYLNVIGLIGVYSCSIPFLFYLIMSVISPAFTIVFPFSPPSFHISSSLY